MNHLKLFSYGSPISNIFNPHPRDLWRFQNLDYSRLCDENHYNKGVRIRQEFLANANAARREACIVDLRNRLRETGTQFLSPINIGTMVMNDFPPEMCKMAKYLEQRTDLDAVGIILSIATITSVACSGRIIIEIIPDDVAPYCQPFILQMIGMAESGSKKSELKDRLCDPISCAISELNIEGGADPDRNITIKSYIEKAFRKKVNTILEKKLDDIDGYWSADNINEFQATVENYVKSQELVLKKYVPTPPKTAYLDNVTPARAYKYAYENGECLNFISAESDIIEQIAKKENDNFRKIIMRGFDQGLCQRFFALFFEAAP